jgi:hypothetical protein
MKETLKMRIMVTLSLPEISMDQLGYWTNSRYVFKDDVNRVPFTSNFYFIGLVMDQMSMKTLNPKCGFS